VTSPVSSAAFWEVARRDPALAGLVGDTYMDADVHVAAERFAASAEFDATWEIVARDGPPAVVVDLGAGTGIATRAFLGRGAGHVYAIEPDPDDTVGAGALRDTDPERCTVCQTVGERLPLPDRTVDLVYARQVLHHADDLVAMVAECARVLRPGGRFLSARDHVAETPADLERFLATHPVHQGVGGEHAYPIRAYIDAVERSGLRLERLLGPLDSVINSFPDVRSEAELAALPERELADRLGRLGAVAAKVPPIRAFVRRRMRARRWPGMLVTIVAVKP